MRILKVEINLDALEGRYGAVAESTKVANALIRHAKVLDALGYVPDQPLDILYASGDATPMGSAWVETTCEPEPLDDLDDQNDYSGVG